MILSPLELLKEVFDGNRLRTVYQRITIIDTYRADLFRRHPHVEIGHPNVSILCLLVPHIQHVIAGPAPIRLLQAESFTDARHDDRLQAKYRLMGLVLYFDLDHARPVCSLQPTLEGWSPTI